MQLLLRTANVCEVVKACTDTVTLYKHFEGASSAVGWPLWHFLQKIFSRNP